MRFIPTHAQWKGWCLPTKLAIVLGLFGCSLSFVFGSLSLVTRSSKIDESIHIHQAMRSSPGSLQVSSDVTIHHLNIAISGEHADAAADPDVRVLRQNIIDGDNGYLRFKVKKEYMNSGFNIPLTVKYIPRPYMPVMITFQNHPDKGPTILFVSPERQTRATMYAAIRFKGARMIYTEDAVFDLFYDTRLLALKTINWAITFPSRPEMEGKSVYVNDKVWYEYFDDSSGAPEQSEIQQDISRIEVMERYFAVHYTVGSPSNRNHH